METLTEPLTVIAVLHTALTRARSDKGIDYLQYRNVRPDYLKEIWKVVNWANVNERLAAATK